MGTVYPTLHQPAQHPLGNETQAFEAYPPAADVKLMAQDPSGMGLGLYGALPEADWGQWWSPQDVAFAEAAAMTAPNVSVQEPQYNNYSFDQEASTQWGSPATSMHSYPLPSPSTEATSIEIPAGDLESRRGSTSTPSDKQKRKRTAIKSTTSRSTRHTSTNKTIKTEASPDKPKPRGSRTKPARQPTEELSPDPDEELDEPTGRTLERNRIASNKFRVKKREDAKKLRSNEEDMEQVNRKLSSCVSDLTLQVYELKMRLLQHTDCDCHLIQNYIASEAHRYIHDLADGTKSQRTPPLPPKHLYRSG